MPSQDEGLDDVQLTMPGGSPRQPRALPTLLDRLLQAEASLRPPASIGQVQAAKARVEEARLEEERLAQRVTGDVITAALLLGSFRAAEAESLPAAIRELVSNVGEKEKITRSRLGERVSRPRSTLYYQVHTAVHVFHLLHEEKRGGKRLLTRNHDVPLPEKCPLLPSVEEVEGLFFGVPAPIGGEWFYRFIDDFEEFGSPEGGPEGVTAAEWAAWVGQPVDLVRERLDVLFHGETLAYDNNTERYAVRRFESPIDSPPAPGEAANPTPTSNS